VTDGSEGLKADFRCISEVTGKDGSLLILTAIKACIWRLWREAESLKLSAIFKSPSNKAVEPDEKSFQESAQMSNPEHI